MAILSETVSAADAEGIGQIAHSESQLSGNAVHSLSFITYLNKDDKRDWVTRRETFNLVSVYWVVGKFGPQWTLTVNREDPEDKALYGISLSFNRGRNAQMKRLSEALRSGFKGPFVLVEVELEDDKRTYSVQPA